MKNIKYYPFERNNYFYGKLLTVRDFHEEQRYMNDKRRISNFLTKGVGVVSGLNVVLLDDKTLLINSGMALDYQGRELILAESITKKLNVIDGFDKLENLDNVYVCIEYKEESKELIHSISGNHQEESYNRILESTNLYLTDTINENSVLSLERLKYSEKVIFNKKGLKVTQSVPVYVRAGDTFEVTVTIEKINLPRAIEIDYIMKSEYLKNDEGKEHLRVYHSDDDLASYKKTVLTFLMKTKDMEEKETILMIDEKESRISMGSEKETIEGNIQLFLKIMKKDETQEVVYRYLEKHFEDVLNQNSGHVICLAKIRLIKRGWEYSIIHFESLPFNQYVLSNQMLYLLLKDTVKQHVTPITPQNDINQQINERFDERKNFVNGMENIYIDLKSKNKVYYSDEIAHGLGKGNTFIEVALEEKVEDNLFYEQNSVYFGDIAILEDTIFQTSLPNIKTMVISYPEKGTFRIVVKVLQDSNVTSLNIFWWAMKNEVIKDRNYAEISNVYVVVSPDTVTIAPKEKIKLNAEVFGTDSQDCRFSIVEENGGEISIHGLYEAPTQEGVYEIIVESIRYPNKTATAFIVVKGR